MAFEKLEAREKSGRGGLPASVTLTNRAAGRPAVLVSLTSTLVDGADLENVSKYDALIGTGDDAGKIRIVASPEGMLVPRVLKGRSLLLDLGFVAALGTTPQRKQFTTARVIENGVVEVDLPDFGADDDDAHASAEPLSETRVDTPPHQPARTAPVEVRALVRKAASAKAESVNGVQIEFADGRECVTFKGKSVDVSPRAAKLVWLLARPRPSPVATSFLVNALWDGKPPGSAMTTLQQIAADLQKNLSPIGLDLRVVRGVGYQLKDL
ncbi:MAG: helix-turn-helix domain-containing protein [Xanthobacteraceae bacterium]